MKRSPAPLAILKDVITGAAQNAAHAEWRDSVRAELSLLPRLAGKTLPLFDSLGFGGDWFDVVPIDSRRTALIVGDVVGHNAGAAARMSQLRTVISTLVQTGTSPSELFRRCDEVLGLRNQTTMATVAAVIVDTEAKTLSTVLAGHPPPLLMPRDGPAARLAPRGGVGAAPSRSSSRQTPPLQKLSRDCASRKSFLRSPP